MRTSKIASIDYVGLVKQYGGRTEAAAAIQMPKSTFYARYKLAVTANTNHPIPDRIPETMGCKIGKVTPKTPVIVPADPVVSVAPPASEISAFAMALQALAAAQNETTKLIARLLPEIGATQPTVPAEAQNAEEPHGELLFVDPTQDYDDEYKWETGIDYQDTVFGLHKTRTTLIGRLPSRSPKKVLVISDTHWHPAILAQCVRVATLIGLHAAASDPDDVVHEGDGPEFASCFKKCKDDVMGDLPRPTRGQELSCARTVWKALNAPMNAANLKARKHYCKGNHCIRIARFAGAEPEREGSSAKVFDGIIKSEGWTISDYGEYYWLGNVAYVHRPLNKMGVAVGGSSGCPADIVASDSTRDTVFGDTHQYACSRALKLDGKIITALNAPSAMPEFFVNEYAQVSAGRKFDYGIMEVVDFDGHIQSHRVITMRELESMYGAAANALLGEG